MGNGWREYGNSMTKVQTDLREALEQFMAATPQRQPEKIAEAFSLERQLRNVDRIFARVFGMLAEGGLHSEVNGSKMVP